MTIFQRSIGVKRLAGITAGIAVAMAGTAALAAPAAAANSQYAHIAITPSSPGFFTVRVYGRINIPAHQSATVTMRLKGDDPVGDDDLGITGSGPAVQTVDDPPGTGSFSISVQASRSALDEDWGQDEIYAWVGASTGWEGLTENRYGDF